MIPRNIVRAVRELVERGNLDIYEMAARLKLDPQVIQAVIDMLT
jgi:hypothetical protein